MRLFRSTRQSFRLSKDALERAKISRVVEYLRRLALDSSSERAFGQSERNNSSVTGNTAMRRCLR